MQEIKREITEREVKNLDLRRIGYSSTDVLSLMCENTSGEEIVLNIAGEELRKLRSFLKKIE